MHLALYLRRSTDDTRQPESLAVQEERLRAFAAKRGDTVVAVFSDSASGVTTKRRRGFARLMDCVQNGATFDAVLVRDVTRWGRFENVDESAYWEFFCVAHGIQVIYAEEQFGYAPKPYDALLKVIRRMYAAESSREKGRLVQAALARLVTRGFRVGAAPYGMRLVEFTKDGLAPRSAGTDRVTGPRGHFKLEPLNDKRTSVVRRIFRWYVKECASASDISRRLNAARVPSPHGRKWTPDKILLVVRNPAYAGVSEARFAASQNFSEPVTITYPGAWPAIVPRSWLAAARERFDRRRRRPDAADTIRHALRRWQWAGPVDEVAASCRERSTPLVGAVSREFVNAADRRALEPLNAFLVETYGAEDVDGPLVMLRGTFKLRQLYSLPVLHRGRASWEFPLPKTCDADGYLLVALSPSPDMRIVQMFLLISRWMKRFGHTDRPALEPKKRGFGLEALRSRIDRFLYATPRAEELFLAAVGKTSVVSTRAISRQLGWSEYAAYCVYARLRQRGVVVPALAWNTRKRITFRCEGCGLEEWRSIRSAMLLSMHLCKRCQARNREYAASTRAACVNCGKSRLLSGSHPVRTERRPNDKCRSCAGKANIIAAKRGSVRARALKRRAYLVLRSAVIDVWGARNGGAAAAADQSRHAPSRLTFPVTRMTKAHARLVITKTDTAARLVDGGAVLVRHVARRIARDAKGLPVSSSERPFVFYVDEFLS